MAGVISGGKFIGAVVVLGVAVLIGAMFVERGGGAPVAKPAVFSPVSFAAALDQNRADGKLLVVKATAEWCPPCKMMNKETFVDPEVVSWIGANAVAIEVDVDAEPGTARELGVEAMPTLIAFRGGKEVGRNVGYMGPGDFRRWMEGQR